MRFAILHPLTLLPRERERVRGKSAGYLIRAPCKTKDPKFKHKLRIVRVRANSLQWLIK